MEAMTTTPNGGVVDFLCVLRKLTQGCANIAMPSVAFGSPGADDAANDEMTWTERELAEATSTALWRTVSMYQPALHGRSPGTLLSMNVALVQLQRHLQRILPLLLADEAHQHHHPSNQPLHTAATGPAVATAHHSASSALEAFHGRVLNYKKSLLHARISVDQLAEWIALCPSFQALPSSSAQPGTGEGDDNGTSDCEALAFPGTSVTASDQRMFARRSSAFDVAVCAFAIAHRMRQLNELLESLERSMLSRSIASSMANGGSHQPPPKETAAGAPTALRDDVTAVVAVDDPYRAGLQSLAAAVSEWLLQARTPLMHLYTDVAMRLLCASDVPDAMAWTIAADRMAAAVGSTAADHPPHATDPASDGSPAAPAATPPHTTTAPPRPYCGTTALVHDAEGRRALRTLLGMIRSCQSVDMLVAMTQWLATAQATNSGKSNPSIADAGAATATHGSTPTNSMEDEDEADDEEPNAVAAAAEWCVQLAAEHCIALMVTSQLMLQECDAREFTRWRHEDGSRRAGADAFTGVATPPAPTTIDCPMCGAVHGASFVCEVARRSARQTVCESVVAALTAQLGHVPSHQLSLIAVAVHRVRFLSDALEQSPIFARLYETERQLLEQQLEGLSSRQRSSFRLEGSGVTTSREHLDDPVSSASSSSAFGRQSGTASATLSSPQFFSLRAERELDGLFLLRPPVFTKDDMDVLHLLAVSTGDDASRLTGSTPSAKGALQPSVLRTVLHAVGQTLCGRRLVVDTKGDANSCPLRNAQCAQVLSLPVLRELMVHASGLSSTLLAAIEDPAAILVTAVDGGSTAPLGTAAEAADALSPLVKQWSRRVEVPVQLDLSEPEVYLAELQRAVQGAQTLLNAPSLGARRGSLLHRSPAVVLQQASESPPNSSHPKEAQHDERVTAAFALKQLVQSYHPSHHGRAPTTLLAVSTACATAARLFRDARRDGAKASPRPSRSGDGGAHGTQSPPVTVAGYTEDQQRLALAETSMWNRAIGHQRSILALSHLEPVSRCGLYIERGTLYFSQSMWVASAHEYAVAERILMSRRAVVASGLRRLQSIRSAAADVQGFTKTYARVLPMAVAAAAAHQQEPQQPPHALNHLLLRLRYNVAVCLWCSGHVDAVHEWLECALADDKGEAHPVATSPSVHALCTSVMHLCTLLHCSLSSDAADGIFYFLGRMSSVVSSHPTVIAGALVLVQHVVEHHVSKRVCNGMTASIKAALHQPRGGMPVAASATFPTMTLEAQSHLVAAACNHLVVELSSGKIPDIHVVLRDGLPLAASSWDKLLVHAIVTCMNFCSAFPDSCWYEAAYQQHMQSVRAFQRPPDPATSTHRTGGDQSGRGGDASSGGSAANDEGVLNKLSKTFSNISNIFSSSVFGGNNPQSPQQRQQLARRRGSALSPQDQHESCSPPLSPLPGGGRRPPHTAADPYESVRKFFERDVELLKLLEWVLTTPLIAIREDDVRVVSVLLDEGFLEIQSLVELRGGAEESRQFAMELQSQTNRSMGGGVAPVVQHADSNATASNLSGPSASPFRTTADIGDGGLLADDADGGALHVVPKPFAYMTSPFALLHDTTPGPKPAVPSPAAPPRLEPVHPPSMSTIPSHDGSSGEFVDVANASMDSRDHHVFASDVQPYVPAVVLDKLVGQTALAVADARRGSAMGSVYSPIMPGRKVTPSASFASRGSPHMLSIAADTILSNAQRAALHHELPMHYQLQPWRSIYSTCHHGTSYRTLLANCVGESPLILCLRIEEESSPAMAGVDAAGEAKRSTIIGALIPNGLRLGHQRFFGGVDTFVFRFEPKATAAVVDQRGRQGAGGATTTAAHLHDGHQHGDDDACAVYRWTHDNEYFVNCRPDYVAVGGGGKGAAIYLDASLDSGSTSQCATFASPPLVPQLHRNVVEGAQAHRGDQADQAVGFDVTAVEVYAVGGRNRT